jgi:hypothetical protein
MDTYKWIKKTHPDEQWSAGHYLRKWLGTKYCIILSQAYRGTNRFNGYCRGTNCATRTWQLNYIYHKFSNPNVKKYLPLLKSNKAILLEPGEYNERFMEFSNSYFVRSAANGHQTMAKSDTWNYVLFWDEVSELEPVYLYN